MSAGPAPCPASPAERSVPRRRLPRIHALPLHAQLELASAVEGTLREWLQRVQAAIAQQARRPRRLLVFVNPFGGSRRGVKIWETTVRPVFDKAGIASHAVETQHGGHARALLTSE